MVPSFILMLHTETLLEKLVRLNSQAVCRNDFKMLVSGERPFHVRVFIRKKSERKIDSEIGMMVFFFLNVYRSTQSFPSSLHCL